MDTVPTNGSGRVRYDQYGVERDVINPTVSNSSLFCKKSGTSKTR